MFVLGGLGPLEYEITDLEDHPPVFSFMVPTKSLLVTSGVDDGRLMSLLEQVDHLFQADIGDGLHLYPLGELVHRYE